MKLLAFLLAAAVYTAYAIAAPPATEPSPPYPAAKLPAGHPDLGKPGKAAEIPLAQKARVLSTIDVPQYTYIEVMQNKKKVWLAATTVSLKKGDVIRFDDGMVMTNFRSNTLKRTFPSIVFVNRVAVTKEKE